MPRSSRGLRTLTRPLAVSRTAPLLASLAGLVLVAGACSAQPVSQVSSVPDTPPAASAPAPESQPASGDPGSASPTTTATASSAPAVAPPDKPAGTTFAIVSEQPADRGAVRQTHRITWQAPDGQATSFVVYGVKGCLRSAPKNNGTPCVIKGMRIPRDALVRLAEASGTDRSIDVTWLVPKSGKEPYAAVLIRAANGAGDSIFTIVHSEDVCVGC
jgi:hypothetical protein